MALLQETGSLGCLKDSKMGRQGPGLILSIDLEIACRGSPGVEMGGDLVGGYYFTYCTHRRCKYFTRGTSLSTFYRPFLTNLRLDRQPRFGLLSRHSPDDSFLSALRVCDSPRSLQSLLQIAHKESQALCSSPRPHVLLYLSGLAKHVHS